MRPGVIPAPRRWVMVGCLQGRRREHAPEKVNKPLTLFAHPIKKFLRQYWAQNLPRRARQRVRMGEVAVAALARRREPKRKQSCEGRRGLLRRRNGDRL